LFAPAVGVLIAVDDLQRPSVTARHGCISTRWLACMVAAIITVGCHLLPCGISLIISALIGFLSLQRCVSSQLCLEGWQGQQCVAIAGWNHQSSWIYFGSTSRVASLASGNEGGSGAAAALTRIQRHISRRSRASSFCKELAIERLRASVMSHVIYLCRH